jgi:proliferating cell nuclear antigen
MSLEHEHLGIPNTDYDALVKMPSQDFQRIIKDLGQVRHFKILRW